MQALKSSSVYAYKVRMSMYHVRAYMLPPSHVGNDKGPQGTLHDDNCINGQASAAVGDERTQDIFQVCGSQVCGRLVMAFQVFMEILQQC